MQHQNDYDHGHESDFFIEILMFLDCHLREADLSQGMLYSASIIFGEIRANEHNFSKDKRALLEHNYDIFALFEELNQITVSFMLTSLISDPPWAWKCA